MPDFTFNCPQCGQVLEASEELVGEVVECPDCGRELTVPELDAANVDVGGGDFDDEDALSDDEDAGSARDDLDELDEDEDDGGDDGDPQRIPGSKRLCPECSEPMEPDAVLCVECGYHVRLKRRIRTEMS